MLLTQAMRFAPLLVLTIGCTGEPVTGGDPLPPPPPGQGVQFSYQFEIAPNSEAWRCNVVDLPTDEFLSVNHVESIQNDAMHHMDLTAIALAAPDLAVGEYDCNEVYARYPALMDDGIIVYASQRAEQEITLPPGIVAELLPRLRVMHEIHFVNSTDQPVTAFSKINAYRYDPDLVENNIYGGAVRDRMIDIPAGAREHVEWTRCAMNADVDVIFLSSHTHALAERTVIRRYDGQSTTAGDILYTNTDWHAPELADYSAAPLHVAKGTGFEFECHYNNPTGAAVHWGFSAAEEMCQIALVYTPGNAQHRCEIVDSGVR